MDLDLARFHAGDERYFGELVRRYSPRLLPALRRYAGVDADPEDVLQETWLRAYAKRRTFDGRGSLLGWLLTVGRTVGLAAVRRRHGDPLTGEPGDAAVPGDPHDRFLADSLREAILALPEREREVVLLRLVEGRSTAEAARSMGCAEGTVKAALSHAVRKLRHSLKEMRR